MKITFLIFFFIIGGCSTLPRGRAPASAPTVSYPTLDFEKLYRTVHKAESVEQALELLSRDYSEFLTSHTYMYDSLSLQEGSFAQPRTLVYGPDASFVFTFNGDKSQRGGYALETMEFDAQANRFLFREIAFKKEMNKSDLKEVPTQDVDERLSNEFVRVTKSNPTRCTQCHGENPNPIWETYFLWPGAYGSEDDILTSLFNRQEIENNPNYAAAGLDKKYLTSIGRQLKLKPGAPDREVDGFRQFILKKLEHPRYRRLPMRAIDQGFVQLGEGKKPEQIDISAAAAAEKERLRNGPYPDRPNLNLMELLYNLASQRLFEDLTRNPAMAKLPAKLYVFDKCVTRHEIERLAWSLDNLKDMDPLSLKDTGLTPAEIMSIRGRVGPWDLFFKRFLVDELGMELEKVNRSVKNFGSQNMGQIYRQVGKKEFKGTYLQGRPPLSFYRSLNPKVSKQLRLLLDAESDGLLSEAQLAYIAKGLGVELEPYATNMRRIATFRESGLRSFFHLVENRAGIENKMGVTSEERDRNCKTIRSTL